MKYHRAPWSASLVAISSLATLLCLGLAIGLIWNGPGWLPWVGLVPLGLIAGSALFTVRGYTITPAAILVHRLFWTTRLPRAGLESARFEPDAMRRSLRLLGNGGLFSFTGLFRSKLLGTYRAFVTDPSRVVVLHYPRRPVLVSPALPEEFIHDLSIPIPVGGPN